MRSNSTAVWEQVKNSTWQESIQNAFVAVNCLVLLVALHVGIVANVFVAWAVYHQKSLQTSNNALLVNLAVIDIFRCAVDCPLLISIIVSSQDLGLLFCSAQITSFSLICCVQLLTLACISAERYQAIAHPFKTTERRKRITVWIPLTWLVPISISVICVIFARDSPVYVRCRGLRMETLDSYDTFGFYILTPVWCVCLTVIIGFYGRIFLLVRAHERKVFDKGSLPPSDKKQKGKETKTNLKNHTENPQKDHEILKRSEKELCEDSNPVSDELPKTTMTDSLDPEMSRENKINFKDELVLEGTVETIDHQNTSKESSPKSLKTSFQNTKDNVSEGSNNLKGGAAESDYHQGGSQSPVNGDISENKPKNNQDITSETSLSNAPQDTTTEVSSELGNEESIEEESKKLQDTTSETSRSTTEQVGTFESNGHQGDSQSPVNGDYGEDQPKNNQDATLELSPALGYKESSQEQSNKHSSLATTSSSTSEQDGTFESNVPQDLTLETSPTLNKESSEEQTSQQDVNPPLETTPGSKGEAAGAPPVEEEVEVEGAVCMMPSLAQRERGNTKKESKLAKRSGYIIFTFLIFWIPLITTVVLNHCFYRNGNLTMEVFRELEILTVSLVCLTSLTNPIIYAAVNPQFRTEFHNLKSKWKAFFTRS